MVAVVVNALVVSLHARVVCRCIVLGAFRCTTPSGCGYILLHMNSTNVETVNALHESVCLYHGDICKLW